MLSKGAKGESVADDEGIRQETERVKVEQRAPWLGLLSDGGLPAKDPHFPDLYRPCTDSTCFPQGCSAANAKKNLMFLPHCSLKQQVSEDHVPKTYFQVDCQGTKDRREAAA